MHKRYFFFDIDGTLTDLKTGIVPESTKKALEILKKKGHFVAIATGRAHYKARPVMEQLHFDHMVCNGGGALVLDKKLIYNACLPYENVLKVYHKAQAYNYGLVFAIDDSEHVYTNNDLFNLQSYYQNPVKYVHVDPDFSVYHYDSIYKMYLSIPKGKEPEFFDDLDIGYVRYCDEFVVVQYDKKKDGILKMINELHGNLEDVVVFGDERNDLVMFDKRWTSIAMGNACLPLKEVADFITTDSGVDGILHACLHYQWISQEDLEMC